MVISAKRHAYSICQRYAFAALLHKARRLIFVKAKSSYPAPVFVVKPSMTLSVFEPSSITANLTESMRVKLIWDSECL